MSTANNNNYSILPWYTSLAMQYSQKENVYGQVWPLIAIERSVPPFQHIRTNALTDAITTFTLVRVETGATTNILLNMTSSGLAVESFTDYDIISYPGNVQLTDMTTPEGQYYCIMGDGTNTWYSEIFWIKYYVDDLIKLQYWHDEPFIIQEYHISYVSPFKYFVYLPAEIGKPAYDVEREIEKRAGYDFQKYITTKKVFRFNIPLPEFMIDALMIVPHHHFVVITYKGITYNVDDIIITPDDTWISQGHLCPVEIEFHTDTVVSTTNKMKPESEGFSYDQSAYDDSHL